jgi:hypothetical protein
LGQLVKLEMAAPLHLGRFKIESSVYGGRKIGLPRAIPYLLAAAVIFSDETTILIYIEGLARY